MALSRDSSSTKAIVSSSTLKSFHLSWGSLVVSTALHAILLGVLTVQLGIYYFKHPNDPRWLKIGIAFATVMDALSQGGISYLVWTHLSQNWGRFSFLLSPTNGVWISAFGIAAAAPITQLYFARRTYLVNNNFWPIVVLTILFSLTSLAFGLSVVQVVYQRTSFKSYGEDSRWKTSIWLVSGLVTDILVTVPVSWHLYQARTGFKSTDHLIAKLIVWIVNTGLISVCLALATVVIYLFNPSNLLFLSIIHLLGAVYPISLTAFLNRRSYWDTAPSKPRLKASHRSMGTISGGIRQVREVHVHSDPGPDEIPLESIPSKREVVTSESQSESTSQDATSKIWI